MMSGLFCCQLFIIDVGGVNGVLVNNCIGQRGSDPSGADIRVNCRLTWF